MVSAYNIESVYKDDFVEIRHNVEYKCLDYSLKKFTIVNEFKTLHEKLLEYIIKNKCNKLLADITEQKAIEPTFQKWMNENWIPRVINAGIIIFAVVVKHQGVVDAGLKQMQRKKSIEYEKLGMKSINFTDIEEARKWITSLKY